MKYRENPYYNVQRKKRKIHHYDYRRWMGSILPLLALTNVFFLFTPKNIWVKCNADYSAVDDEFEDAGLYLHLNSTFSLKL